MEKSDKALLRRYHEEGDLAAREQLIEQYMSLVRSLARRYSYRGEQFEDLVQIGAIGLIKAIDRFDLERGVELTTYATPNIIGEIKRHFRDRGWSVRVPRGLQELNIQLSRLLEEKTVEFGRSPTIAELAKAAEVSDEEVLEALESGRAVALGRPRPGRRRRPRPARFAGNRGARVRGLGGPGHPRARVPRPRGP
jgi:RNA polymerase sigma-B factor